MEHLDDADFIGVLRRNGVDVADIGQMPVVLHGATATTARPVVNLPVIWIGSVEPDNWSEPDGDVWLDTDAEPPEVTGNKQGVIVKLTYQTTAVSGVSADGWYYPDGTTPDLTGRLFSVMWEGTAVQIPSQGVGDADFKTGDTAMVRTATL